MPLADGGRAESQFSRSRERRIRRYSCQPLTERAGMRIKLTSIMVDDQEKAVRFYTDVLGFVKRKDFPVGEYRWITVTSPEVPTDLELALEPNACGESLSGCDVQAGHSPGGVRGERPRR